MNLLLDKVTSLRPQTVLDVGCGCGSFTVELASHCGTIIAIDSGSALITRCKTERPRANIIYFCADGRSLPFQNHRFNLVFERDSLHHVLEWERILGEMARVSSNYLLIEEPIDDPRNDGKRNMIMAQDLFLEVQKEANYPHYRHLVVESVLSYFRDHDIAFESQIIRSDRGIDIEEYFGPFEYFAERTSNKDYWLKRLKDFKTSLDGKALIENDNLVVVGKLRE